MCGVGRQHLGPFCYYLRRPFELLVFLRAHGFADPIDIKVNRVGELIERLGMTDELKSKITVPDSDIVSELVAKGELELGIVVLTQILTTPGVELVGPLPPDIQYSFQFTAGVSAQSKAPAAARDLLKFFGTPTAIPVIKSQGMEPG
jgi:molybdate transport system substrate-binding protein